MGTQRIYIYEFEMAHLIIGERGCEANRVILAMQQAEDEFESLVDGWRDLATKLGTKPKVVRLIERKIIYDHWAATQITSELLTYWKSKESQNATLENWLKALEMYELNSMADKIRNEFKLSADSVAIPQELSNDNVAIFNAAVNLVRKPMERSEPDYYKLPKDCKGYALLINIMNYPDSKYRHGTEHDSVMLKEILIQLGYNVTNYDNPKRSYTKRDIENIIELFRNQVRKERSKSIVVYMGCHGCHDGVEMSDGELVNFYNSVVYKFDSENCPELIKVPKIFISQSCRIFMETDDSTVSMDNAIVCYGTLPGKPATRDPLHGSTYVRILVKALEQKAHCMHFTQILNEVHENLRKEDITLKDGTRFVQKSIYEEPGNGKFRTLYFNLD